MYQNDAVFFRTDTQIWQLIWLQGCSKIFPDSDHTIVNDWCIFPNDDKIRRRAHTIDINIHVIIIKNNCNYISLICSKYHHQNRIILSDRFYLIIFFNRFLFDGFSLLINRLITHEWVLLVFWQIYLTYTFRNASMTIL